MNTSEQIWHEYHDRLHGFIQSRVGDPSLADDILQQVFVKIHAKIDTLKDDQKMQPWVYQIARNTITDYYRTHKETHNLPEILEPPDEDPIDIERRNMSGCLVPIIKSLPEIYSEALILSETEELTYKEMAERLGITPAGAKARVLRGRKMARDSVLRCCHLEFDSRGNVIDYEAKEGCKCPAKECE